MAYGWKQNSLGERKFRALVVAKQAELGYVYGQNGKKDESVAAYAVALIQKYEDRSKVEKGLAGILNQGGLDEFLDWAYQHLRLHRQEYENEGRPEHVVTEEQWEALVNGEQTQQEVQDVGPEEVADLLDEDEYEGEDLEDIELPDDGDELIDSDQPEAEQPSAPATADDVQPVSDTVLHGRPQPAEQAVASNASHPPQAEAPDQPTQVVARVKSAIQVIKWDESQVLSKSEPAMRPSRKFANLQHPSATAARDNKQADRAGPSRGMVEDRPRERAESHAQPINSRRSRDVVRAGGGLESRAPYHLESKRRSRSSSSELEDGELETKRRTDGGHGRRRSPSPTQPQMIRRRAAPVSQHQRHSSRSRSRSPTRASRPAAAGLFKRAAAGLLKAPAEGGSSRQATSPKTITGTGLRQQHADAIEDTQQQTNTRGSVFERLASRGKPSVFERILKPAGTSVSDLSVPEPTRKRAAPAADNLPQTSPDPLSPPKVARPALAATAGATAKAALSKLRPDAPEFIPKQSSAASAAPNPSPPPASVRNTTTAAVPANAPPATKKSAKTSAAPAKELLEVKQKLKQMEADLALLRQKAQASAAQPRVPTPAAASAARAEVDTRSIVVSNLGPAVNDNVLHAHFGVCGTIKRITVLRDKYTGFPKGVAYVEFTAREAALTASRELNGIPLLGQPVLVVEKSAQVSAAAGKTAGLAPVSAALNPALLGAFPPGVSKPLNLLPAPALGMPSIIADAAVHLMPSIMPSLPTASRPHIPLGAQQSLK